MDGPIIVAIVVVVIVVVAIAAIVYMRNRRKTELQQQFGTEYGHAVDQYGGERRAEKVLVERRERVESLHIVPLSQADRDRFAQSWRDVQAHFVDDPVGAIGDADTLVGQVMQARGYPIGNFEQNAADISVDHPEVVDHYRAAHDIATSQADRSVSTEDLRSAMIHYRALVADLLETSDETANQTAEATR